MSTVPGSQTNALALTDLIAECRQEARQPRAQETGACFELFCRALDGQDRSAWAALQSRYRPLITGWIRTRLPTLPAETLDDLVQETWLALWHSLTRRAIQVRQQFPHVGAILRYLRGCAMSALVEYQRRERQQARLREALARQPLLNAPPDIWQEIDHKAEIAAARKWIHDNVTDPQERLYLHLAFEQGLKPAAIQRRAPDQFPNVQTVYRVQERVLKRARRALAPFRRKDVGKRA